MVFSEFVITAFSVIVTAPENLARCRELLGVVAPTTETQRDYRERYRQLTGQDPLRCPQCQIGEMLRIAVLPAQVVTTGWDSS